MLYRSKTINAGSNAKTVKGDGAEYVTGIMYLAPYNMSGFNTCAMAEKAGCIDACLNTAGRGAFNSVQEARIAKTKRFMTDRKTFMLQLEQDIATFERRVTKRGAQACIRLNGTSDIRWESVAFVSESGVKYRNIMDRFPDVQFYDYTKISNRRNLPDNYRLTFSYSGVSPEYSRLAFDAFKAGHNVAVVFKGKAPQEFLGRPVINGDVDDMRFTDPSGVVVALKAKGKAKQDESGFVVHWERETMAYRDAMREKSARLESRYLETRLSADHESMSTAAIYAQNADFRLGKVLTW